MDLKGKTKKAPVKELAPMNQDPENIGEKRNVVKPVSAEKDVAAALISCQDLETANKELVILNEELTLINEELLAMNEELSATREELWHQKEFFEKVVNTAKALIVGLDGEGRVVLFNPYCEQLTGWKREEVLGKDWFSCFIPERYRPEVSSVFAEISGNNMMNEFDNPILTKSGEELVIAWNNTVIRDNSGEIELIIGTGTNITERRKNMVEMAKIAAIVESCTDAILSKTLDGIIKSWNKGAEALYGYRAAEIVDRPINILVPPERQDEISMILAKLQRGEKVEHYETIRVRKDGSQFYVSLTISPIIGASGQIKGASSIARDITKQKEAEEVLQRMSYLDGLTEISNRRRFDETIQAEWNRGLREERPLSLVMLDIDFFKLFNDTYGHLKGDDCLKQVAALINNTINRPGDVVARYGGEEFAVILPSTNSEGAARVAEKIRAGVEGLKIDHAGSAICPYVTVSLGVVTVVPVMDFSSEMMIAAADKALYKAKNSGRNRVAVLEEI